MPYAYAQSQTPYTCGIDLHAKKLFATVINQQGKVSSRKELPCEKKDVLDFIMPFSGDISIGVESTFNWYWLADLCKEQQIPFYLGHALYMKHIHGAKQKNDPLDSKKIGNLLRTGFFPQAYAYPQAMRAVRDLLRHRLRLVRLRSSIYTNIKNILYQAGIIEFPQTIVSSRKHWPDLLKSISDTATLTRVTSSLALLETYDKQIVVLEKQALTMAQEQDKPSMTLLHSIPGVGNILAMTLLYETHTTERFKTPARYSSYARTVKVDHSSAGKIAGVSNHKIGNPYLSWAYAEVCFQAKKNNPQIKCYFDSLLTKHSKNTALSRLRHKFSVAAFYMLKNKVPFDIKRFCNIDKDDNPTGRLEKTQS
jgi:transposase